MQEAGELVTVTGAERDEEIGGIVDIYQRTMGAPAVMFDDIPGFPPGHRVVANILTSVRRINLTLGLPADTSEMDLGALLAQLHEKPGDHSARHGRRAAR